VIASGDRAVSEAPAEYGIAWTYGAERWPRPRPGGCPSRKRPGLGIDETRSRWVCWVLEEAGSKRSDPWMTSFVAADPAVSGRLLGLAPGCSGSCVREWLALQSPAVREGIELVVVDPARRTRRGPDGRCRTRGSRSTSGTWSHWPTSWSPRSASAPPVSCTAVAGSPGTRCGPTGSWC
jgi:hypothetical protein